jgi:HTH-type transcriptional regulator/antitoxin HigA
MDKIKVIKTEKDYEEALKLLEGLMNHDPDPNSVEGEQLSILSTLIQDYETRLFPEKLPNPIEAIKFRMEQTDLKPADLIPYIGSRSRVSEILSGKRQLTIEMVRALEAGLDIPAKVLIQKLDQNTESQYQHWDSALIKTMGVRGYFGNMSLNKYNKSELLKNFFSKLGIQKQPAILFRKGSYRSAPLTDKNALSAWMIRILQKAEKIKMPIKYKRSVVNLAFMQNLTKLSVQEKNPLIVQEYLKKYGIKMVVEPGLPKTHLDGAVILTDKNNPIIGLTLRYDRLDNFWFTLMHELAHINLHYDNKDFDLFYDEFEKVKGLDISPIEKEADNLAGEALVPSSKWEISPARLIPSSIAANSLAKELGVHVAIIAGKIRYEDGKWMYLNSIIDQEKVRKYFPNEKCDKK